VLGGLIVLASSSRPFAIFGAWLAAVSGAWFALGNVLTPIFSSNGLIMNTGAPVGGTVTRALEQIGFFTGLGLVIVLLAGMAIGRFSVIGVRETRLAERAAAAQEAATRTEPVTPVTTGPVGTEPKAPAGTEPGTTTARLPRRRVVPERKTDKDAGTGTTTAETRPDGERVDSTTAAQ
jgi:hypothetical protein